MAFDAITKNKSAIETFMKTLAFTQNSNCNTLKSTFKVVTYLGKGILIKYTSLITLLSRDLSYKMLADVQIKVGYILYGAIPKHLDKCL